MSSVTIRPASILDISSMVQVRLGAVTEQEVSGFTVPGDNLYVSVEQLRAMWETNNLLNDGCEVFVAERRGQIVGFIVYNMNSCNDNIDNLIVAKDEQRKGVGRALVEYVENLAKSRGYNVIRTDTIENAEGVPWKAYGFWRTMDYEDTGERVPTEYGFKVIPLVKSLK
ncbi:MAG: GNAT family N-acetyltransferase [Candidatus Bathyarchaeota archaeon]|nr:GNAT family N-acetyltransferase [Candidatus Bathyarchaeota archaeon]